MQKKLLSGLFWMLLLNLLIKPFWILGIEVGVQNAVDVSEYGFYFAIFNMAYIFNILLDMGITNFNTRNIAQYPKQIDKHLSGMLSIKLLLLAFYLLVTFSVGLAQGYSSRQFYLLAFLCLNQFLNSLILFLRSNFEGLLLFKWDSVISILDRVIMIVICGALLWMPGHPTFRIEYFVYAQTAAYLLTAAVALAALIGKVKLGRLRFSLPFTLAIIKRSLPYAMLVLLMASYNRIDPILLKQMVQGDEGHYLAGIYAGAFRLLDALTMIAYLVSVPLLPIFSKITKAPTAAEASSPSHEELASTTWWVTSLLLVFSITAAVTGSSLAKPLMGFFYEEHAVEYAAAFRILIFGIIPISMTYVYGTLLTAAGRLRQLNIMAGATLAVNVAVNVICIPRMGVVGASIASLTAQTFMATAQMILAMRLFRLRPTGAYILKLIVFALLIVVFCGLTPAMEWRLKLLTAVVVAAVAALAMGMVNAKEIWQTLRKRGTL